jgi:hypothetical protein
MLYLLVINLKSDFNKAGIKAFKNNEDMKTKSFIPIMLFLSLITWSCSTNEVSQGSLKESINKSVQNLTTALNTISASNGYQILAISSSTTTNTPNFVKSSVAAFDTTFNSILLTDIAGVYDYKAVKSKRGPMQLMHFFIKTRDTTDMIVRLPEAKVKHPESLLQYFASDTLLTNNYIIDLSKYDYHFNPRLGWDYQMASNINIKGTNVGALAIQSSNSMAKGYKYASEFVFADGYQASCTYASGDTAVATYDINNGSKVLYSEKYTAIMTKGSKENRHHEQQYSLTIGNVEIVREMGRNGLDSAKVYVGGVLQSKAKIQIVDDVTVSNTTTEDAENSVINHKRELIITFEDGTSSTISDLLGTTSITTIRSLFASLRQSSFAVGIVDWIAWDIYTNKQ